VVTETPTSVLQHYWGYDHFRQPQLEIIEAVLNGKDVLALLPTGGGKSICFQVPALLKEGVCLVITPLIALMQDQVSQLKERGIHAVAIHSGMTYAQIDITLDNCIYGKVKFLYLSPERLQTELFSARLKRMKLSLVAVDEAHCISQWGHDFRPPYLEISTIRDTHPLVPILALTASATSVVQKDIIQSLKLRKSVIYQKSFARENLSFLIRQTENKEKKLLEALQRVPGSAIVYVRSRKTTESVAKWLIRQHISATYYHAGLTYAERSQRQEAWITNQCRVMVATNAFGMGINKADVRTVIHLDLPENLESYYQEAGRAGRDGKKSFAAIVYHPSDIDHLRSKVEISHPSLEELKKMYQALANYFQLAEGSGMSESFDFDLEEFASRFSLKPLHIYPALKKLEEEGLIQLNEGFYRPSQVHITVEHKKLYEFQVAHARFDPLIKALLRLYGGELFSEFMIISESQVARALKWRVEEVGRLLNELQRLQLLEYLPANERPSITYLLPRQDSAHLPIQVKRMNERRELHFGQMEKMIAYVEQRQQCRMQFIQEYFDEETFITCGVCDVCVARKKKENLEILKDYESQVLYLLKQRKYAVEELEKTVDPKDRELFMEVIRDMVDQGQIKYDAFWMLSLT
jgi:ATP-dependent DNA helicase RecQ